ncbi:heat stress transcription factor A-6b-like [Gastrolobium bilobum]|uniref:heat stress transcription factor A-6b-like n=1 Tax=Gastrolobium bilobum TaxID=150636 RepID=UPI002AB30FFE|nr:heat stress transcription factor A-6b-like [Gastrolobium bilobum]
MHIQNMNPVKEEFQGESCSFSGDIQPVIVPQPMEGLHESGPPPFLTKTYDIIDDASTNEIVSWSKGNNSFIVWDPQAFSITLLPKYFKHKNFSSFVRQLNTYGFRKVDPDKWEFANEEFLRGQRHLLKNIRRRKTTHPQPSQQAMDHCVEVGRFGFDGEIDRLRRDKQVLMVELVKLRQQQQNTISYLQLTESRLKKTEQKQKQMMNFLARAMQNPNFVQQLVQQKELRKELEEYFFKKKRGQPIDQGPSNIEVTELVHAEEYSALVKLEQQDPAMNMGEQSGTQKSIEEKGVELESNNKDIDKVLWEEFLNEGMEDNLVGFKEDDEYINVLVEELGYLASSSE